MSFSITELIKKSLRQKHHRKYYYTLTVSLAAIVVFCTTYALILPAITQERPVVPDCELVEHEHSEECYQSQLICEYADEEENAEDSASWDVEDFEDQHLEDEGLPETAETAAEHIHSEECYEKVLICDLPEHEHTADCYPEWTEKIEEIIASIDELPEPEEATQMLAEFDEDDEEGFEACLSQLQQQFMSIYPEYEELDPVLQKCVTNSEKLLSFEWLYVEPAAEAQSLTEVDVFAVNGEYNETDHLGYSFTQYSVSGESFSKPDSTWTAVLVGKSNGYYVVEEVNPPGTEPREMTPSPEGFVYFFQYGYAGKDADKSTVLDVSAGKRVVWEGGAFWLTNEVNPYSSTPWGTLSFTAMPRATPNVKENKDISELETVAAADTSSFIEVNLYDYGDNVNDKYVSNKYYPGFQQTGGVGIVQDHKKLRKLNNTDYYSFGDNITKDLLAGRQGVTVGNGSVSGTIKQSVNVIINSGTYYEQYGAINLPFSVVYPDVMYKTLYNGYPAVLNSASNKWLSLDYLFSDNKYAKKVNSKSVNGLFQYDDETGLYTFNSLENHAQYDKDTDTFTLYKQVITPNYLMYPFGNFLPFNDITTQCQKSSLIDKEYLQSIADSAAAKSASGSDQKFVEANFKLGTSDCTHPYQNLSEWLNNFITDMANVGITTAKGYHDKYFQATKILQNSDGRFADLDNIYSLDFDEESNFYFGMEMKLDFVQSRNGVTSKGQEMILRFTGDDDVWFYIDDILFLDLGGIHRHVGGEIDFYKGEVRYYPLDEKKADVLTSAENGTPAKPAVKFRDILLGAGLSEDEVNSLLVTKGTGASKRETFTDYSNHSMHFYYMERGSGSGVCRMEFNMEQTAPTGIYKVNQYGDKVAGATFAIYKATDDYKYLTDGDAAISSSDFIGIGNKGELYYLDGEGKEQFIGPVYTGTTNEDGEMIFTDTSDNKSVYYSIAQLKQMFGDHFIMREIGIPEGYRTVGDEIKLYFDQELILCYNVYESGSWISPNATVLATETLDVASEHLELAEQLRFADGKIPYYTENAGIVTQETDGTLFAVVLKKNGAGNFDFDSWTPIIGNDDEGYHVVSGTGVQAAIDAAQDYYSKKEAAHCFTVGELRNVNAQDSTTVEYGMVTYLSELPGDPTQYFSYIYDRGEDYQVNTEEYLAQFDNCEYAVMYYFTTGSFANPANPPTTANTVRVSSHKSRLEGSDSQVTAAQSFHVVWSATIEVPNIVNSLYYQKVDTYGNLLENPTGFAMYEAVDGPSLDDIAYFTGTDSSGGRVYILLSESDYTAEVYDTSFSKIADGYYTIVPVSVEGLNFDQYSEVMLPDVMGNITVTAGGKTYSIRPAVNGSAGGAVPLTGFTHNKCSYIKETATGHFMYLKEGNYILREVTAPDGYSLNKANVLVTVNSHGVYANAGAVGDGITVGNGPGLLVKTLDTFASISDIDETLAWIYGLLRVVHFEGFLDYDLNDIGSLNYSYSISETGDNYSSGKAGTDSRNPYEQCVSDPGSEMTEAMVTYLRYEGSASNVTGDGRQLFDYSVYYRNSQENIDKLGEFTPSVEKTILWTDTGWADLEVCQDTWYGKNNSSPYASYTYLTENPTNPKSSAKDIANLFSSSTFVRVADPQVVDPSIKKVDSYSENSALPNAKFVIYRENNGVKEYYKYELATTAYPYNTTRWLSLADLPEGQNESEFAISTDANGLLNLKGLEHGTYTIEEIEAPAGYQLLAQPVTFTVGGVDDNGLPINGQITSVGESAKLDPNSNGLQIFVYNTSTARLPDTGGPGTFSYACWGILLMCAASGIYGYQRCRRSKGVSSGHSL